MAMDKDTARQRADSILQAESQKTARKYDKLHWLSMPAFYRTAKLKTLPITAQKSLIAQAIQHVHHETAFKYLKLLYVANTVLAGENMLSSHSQTGTGFIFSKILVAITLMIWGLHVLKTRAYIDQTLIPQYKRTQAKKIPTY